MGNISNIAFVDKHVQMTLNKLIIPILFIFSALCLCWFYNYFEILFWQPQGIHFMRQTDCLSFISYYLKTGAPLWEPGLLCLYSHDGKTASEFPAVYYALSFVWKYAGKQEFLLRLFNLTVFFVGVYHLLLMFKKSLLRWHISVIAVLFIITSPVIVYYANNFLPDISAMALAFIALRYSYEYLSNHRNERLVKATIFYTLSALLKISYFIYPAAFFVAVLVTQFSNNKMHKELKRLFVYFLFSLIVCGSWMYYVVWYNRIHTGYFLSTYKAYWMLDESYIQSVWKHILEYWYGWHLTVFAVFGLFFSLLLILDFKKYVSLTAGVWGILAALAGFAYLILFFGQLHDHDYYILTIIPAFALLFMNMLSLITQQLPLNYAKTLVALVVGIFLYKNLFYTQNFVRWRYWDSSINDPYARVGIKLLHADKELTNAGISEDARLVFVPDDGYSGCTYFTNRFGWQLGSNYENELTRITAFKEQGASHLVIIDTALFSHAGLLAYTDSVVLKTPNYIVYSLK
jgi:hypothetical protein